MYIYYVLVHGRGSFWRMLHRLLLWRVRVHYCWVWCRCLLLASEKSIRLRLPLSSKDRLKILIVSNDFKNSSLRIYQIPRRRVNMYGVTKLNWNSFGGLGLDKRKNLRQIFRWMKKWLGFHNICIFTMGKVKCNCKCIYQWSCLLIADLCCADKTSHKTYYTYFLLDKPSNKRSGNKFDTVMRTIPTVGFMCGACFKGRGDKTCNLFELDDD